VDSIVYGVDVVCLFVVDFALDATEDVDNHAEGRFISAVQSVSIYYLGILGLTWLLFSE
jgi:hypothetical protein